MKIGPLNLSWGKKSTEGLSIEQVMRRFEAAYAPVSGIAVTPENCMMSPTMTAIVTAISRRIASLPIEVMRQTEITEGEGEAKTSRVRKEVLPNHVVAKLLRAPNDWQDPVQFWLDATSYLVRYNNFYAFKSRGVTGPTRSLIPLNPAAVGIDQDVDWRVTYRAGFPGGGYQELKPGQLLHARGASRDGLHGASIVHDIREAIGLEIQAERMGAAVFGNSALPSIIFKYGEGSQGFETDEQAKQFIEDFQRAYSGKGRFSAMLLPEGIEIDTSSPVDNDKAQFVATRQYQRTVIAAAFGVPPHMVGDLSRGTFNNVEQQSLDFVVSVVLPYVRIFEAAMERSLLTDDDRNSGIIIRFNLDAILRGDFLSRQQGLNIQRQAGVINANEWRAVENMNPIADDEAGETYWSKGPSGQGATDAPPAGQDQPQPPKPANENEEGRNDAAANA